MQEATASYAQSQTGPWILEVLRSYRRQGAASAFTAAVEILKGCHSFTMAWTAPAGFATESVRSMGSVDLGNRSWSASLSISGTIAVIERLVLVQVGSSLMLLEAATAAGPLRTAQVSTIAAHAAAKLAR